MVDYDCLCQYVPMKYCAESSCGFEQGDLGTRDMGTGGGTGVGRHKYQAGHKQDVQQRHVAEGKTP